MGAAEGRTSSLVVCACISELHTALLLAETANGKAACVSLRLGQRPLGHQIYQAGLQQPGRWSLLLFSSKEGSKNCLHFCLSTQVSLSYVQHIIERLRFQELLLFTIVAVTG